MNSETPFSKKHSEENSPETAPPNQQRQNKKKIKNKKIKKNGRLGSVFLIPSFPQDTDS